MEKTNVQLNNKKLALFFTYSVSLELWKNKGMLQRELALYKEMGKYLDHIYFITYGKNDQLFQSELALYNITVLPKPKFIPNFLYSFCSPFIYRNILSQCNFYKTNQMLGSWSGAIAKILFKKPFIVRTGYTLSLFSKRQNYIKYLFSLCIEYVGVSIANRIIVATPAEKEVYKRWTDKIRLVPNYVDTNIFFPRPEAKNTGEKMILLYIGRLSKQKNISALVQSLAGIKNVTLQIVGTGELKEDLVELAKTYQVDVEFLGAQPYSALPHFINYANIFVLPSLYEGNPKVLLEAMSCCSTVLATKVEGIENIIIDRENGYLSGTSFDDLHKAVNDLVSNIDDYGTLGKNAREYILQNNSLRTVVDQELFILEQL